MIMTVNKPPCLLYIRRESCDEFTAPRDRGGCSGCQRHRSGPGCPHAEKPDGSVFDEQDFLEGPRNALHVIEVPARGDSGIHARGEQVYRRPIPADYDYAETSPHRPRPVHLKVCDLLPWHSHDPEDATVGKAGPVYR